MALVNIQNPNNWKRTGKKSYEIWVCRPPVGTKVYNELEDCHYTTSEQKPFVLSGTAGEQWVIDFAKLAKTYVFATGEPISLEAIVRKSKNAVMDWVKVKTIPGQMCNFAILLPKSEHQFRNFPVKTSWGEVLLANRDGIKHGDGDYLVCAMAPNGQPNLNDVWVVNGRIFPATYNLQNFNVSPKAKMHADVQVPKPEALVYGGKGQTGIKTFVDSCVSLLEQHSVKVRNVLHNTVADEKLAENNGNDEWTIVTNEKELRASVMQFEGKYLVHIKDKFGEYVASQRAGSSKEAAKFIHDVVKGNI